MSILSIVSITYHYSYISLTCPEAGKGSSLLYSLDLFHKYKLKQEGKWNQNKREELTLELAIKNKSMILYHLQLVESYWRKKESIR